MQHALVPADDRTRGTAGEVAEAHPHLTPLANGCRFMTRWGFVYRNPTEPSGDTPPPPSDSEIGRAQAILAELGSAIAAYDPERRG